MADAVSKPKQEFEPIAPDKLKQALSAASLNIKSHEQSKGFEATKSQNLTQPSVEIMKNVLNTVSKVIYNTIDKSKEKQQDMSKQAEQKFSYASKISEERSNNIPKGPSR